VHPFTIMFTLPTAGVGVILAFVMTGTSASVPAFLGIVMLAGIAVNNGILLVDVANRRRQAGDSAHDAIVHAGRVRLRPILMTSLTTVLGMVPMALGGEGSELRAPLAIAVIGGLTASTLLTLVLVPVVYDGLERLSSRRRAGVRAGVP
jgi:HAE1 family hydrophobic/amphiphilic exporter-1